LAQRVIFPILRLESLGGKLVAKIVQKFFKKMLARVFDADIFSLFLEVSKSFSAVV
jgi:hypothetical protein